MKRQCREWEKIFTSHICGKGLLEYIENSYKSATKRQMTQFKNGQTLNRYFFKEDILHQCNKLHSTICKKKKKKRRYNHGQQTHEKMLGITDYQGDANGNHTEGIPWWASGLDSGFHCQGCRSTAGQVTKMLQLQPKK